MKDETPLMADGLPSLRVQIVLYGNEPDLILSSMSTVFNALTQAAERVGRWTVALGDSSTVPVLDGTTLTALRQAAELAGGTIEYEFFAKNLGHGGGHNRLHEASNEDLLLILNPDGALAPDTILRLIDALTPEFGVVDARQLPLEHPKEYDGTTGEASWSSLACALTPSAVFKKVGGIDHETFFMYCDDVDYSWRVRLTGLKVRYCPQARMFHDKRMDSEGQMQASEAEYYYSAEAALMLAHKYSREDVLMKLLREMEHSEDRNRLRAARAFRKRKAAGKLPQPIDKAHEVAEFVGRTYGAHRF